MGNKIGFSALFNWLKSTEMFARPSKKIPGKWILNEFYFEPENELVHIGEERLKNENLFWELEFAVTDQFIHHSNLSIPFIDNLASGRWSRSRNLITLTHPPDSTKSIEFQFAIEKETLKLLKKDSLGRIQFFGFFRKMKDQK
jgi:hypothetical protein